MDIVCGVAGGLGVVQLGGRGYSAEVHFDVPEGTPVVWRRDHEAEWSVPY